MYFIPLEMPKGKIGNQEVLAFVEDCQLIKNRRIELGYTQQQIADIAGIKLRHYQRVESGENHITNCTGKVMMRILVALRINPFEFFPQFNIL